MIELPSKFKPYPWQDQVFQAFCPEYYGRESSERIDRGVSVVHRRGGKDILSTGIMEYRIMRDKPANYLYCFPQHNAVRRAIWNGIDMDGTRFLDYFHKDIVAKRKNTEMMLEFINGSTLQFVGSDNYDSLMGSNYYGIVMSEYSLQNPNAWAYLAPILRRNGGWVFFQGTPRGKNHLYTLYENFEWQQEQGKEEYRAWKFTVDDTVDDKGDRLITEEDIEQERSEGRSEEIIDQEYRLSWEGAAEGAYFGPQIRRLREEGRLGFYPHNPGKIVRTFWDIGVNDANAIWFVQYVDGGWRLIDYIEGSDKGVLEWIKIVKDKPYLYDEYHSHFFQHDGAQRDKARGLGLDAHAREVGFNVTLLPKLSNKNLRESARRVLPMCQFHKDDTEQGFDALAQFSRKWDQKTMSYANSEDHNWASHGAKAFQYFALAAETVPQLQWDGSTQSLEIIR